MLKSPILYVHFLQNLSTMNVLDPIFFITCCFTIFTNELLKDATLNVTHLSMRSAQNIMGTKGIP